MIFRMELPRFEVIDILDVKYIGPKAVGYTFPSRIYDIVDIN